MTKRPSDLKTFLTNDENKIQLVKLLRQLRATIPITTVDSHCKTKGSLSRNKWRNAHPSKSNTNTIFRSRRKNSRVASYWKYAQDHTLTFSCTIDFDGDWEQQTPGKYDRLGVLDSLRNTALRSWYSSNLLIVIPPVLLRNLEDQTH